ncbi:MAG: hypothetical protein AAF716_03850 [Cyanobacteria bacterium P01_D01_bin.1]
MASQQKKSDYERFRVIAANRPEFFPVEQSLPPDYYKPIAPWMGRLILPAKEQRQAIQGVLFEVHHAPVEFQYLVGNVVILRFSNRPDTSAYVNAATQDLNFSAQAEKGTKDGLVLPTRLDHWRLVTPLESLAGAHPTDDVIVALPNSTIVIDSLHGNRSQNSLQALMIDREPMQITGRYYALVKFAEPVQGNGEKNRCKVVHFNKASRRFDGLEEKVSVPEVPRNTNATRASVVMGIEDTDLNQFGWYIYGVQDESGTFVVRAIAPRKLLTAEPERIVTGEAAAEKYATKEVWAHIKKKKGTVRSTLLKPTASVASTGSNTWIEGQQALLIHVYGGVGGQKAEPAAKAPFYFGHFAYGTAEVVREPLTGDLRFEIVYHQIYTHNSEGLIAGSLHWSRYMGDRTFGILGLRPVVDTLFKLDEFTGDYGGQGWNRSPLDRMMYELQIMAARYRIGDGTGVTFVGPANNCAQDANQALYAALRYIAQAIRQDPNVENWKQQHPEQAIRLYRLEQLTEDFKHVLLP